MGSKPGFFIKVWNVIVAIVMWFKCSFEENGKASGKAFTAFALTATFIYSILTAIKKSPLGLIPDYLVIPLVSLIGGLYAVKLAGKVSDNITAGKVMNSETMSASEKRTDSVKKPDNEIG